MKRLLETEADSPLVARAQRLIASAQPLPLSQERMWRIRRALDQPRGAFAFFRGVPAIGVAGALLFFGATAFAAVRVMTNLVAGFDSRPSGETAQLPAAKERARALPAAPLAEADALLGTAAPALQPQPGTAPARLQPIAAASQSVAVAVPAQPQPTALESQSVAVAVPAQTVAGATPAPTARSASASRGASLAVRAKHARHSARAAKRSGVRVYASRPGAAQVKKRAAPVAPASDGLHSTELASASDVSAAGAGSGSAMARARAGSSDVSARVGSESVSASSTRTDAPARSTRDLEASAQAANAARERAVEESDPAHVEDADLSRAPNASPEVPRDPEAGSELVHRALKALRRDRDPEEAARLLARHRARYPEGALAEEALALQVEAATLTDRASARTFAREYLSRFPNGRYRSAAERALQERGL